MAIAYFDFKRFKTALKNGYDYTILYDNKKYNVGLRYYFIRHYYFLSHNTLEFKVYYTVDDLLRNIKLGHKSLEEVWDEVEIIKERGWISFKEEIKLLEKYRELF